MDSARLAASELLDQHPIEAAYHAVLTEVDAVGDADNVHVTLDMTRAVTTALGALPKLKALRAEIEAEFRNFDLGSFDKLGQYTLALHHAHTRWRAASRPKQDLSELGAKLEALRDRLLADARSLAGHGLVDGKRLDECGEPGYRAMASDVLVVVDLLKAQWGRVQGRTPLTVESLNTAASQALELLSEVGLRDQAPAVMGEASVRRLKSFILFRRVYDRARNAVVYLRGEEAADEIIPSLYAGRRKRGAAQEEATQPTEPSASEPARNGDSGVRAAATGTGHDNFVVDNASGLPITHPLKK